MTRYTNYVMKNNVFAELEAPIGSLATTIQLKDGQGARWGNTFPILATLENFDSNGKCTKREIVQITARSGDYLTVVRGYAPCPANDDANSQGTSTYSFGADDRISLYITKEHFDKIDDGFTNTNEEIDDLHENGTDELRTYKTTGLGVEIKPGKVLVGSAYYNFDGGTLTLTNNATNYIEIDKDGNLVANTTGRGSKNSKVSIVTTSGGEITNIEDWRLATVGGEIGGVNIHDLTEKTSISSDDELIIADSDNIYNNKKVKYSTINKPKIDFLIVGGGGGGGGGGIYNNQNMAGRGGGGGEALEVFGEMLLSTSYSITIGNGGGAGTCGNFGGNGGDSTFNGYTARGGCGGHKGISQCCGTKGHGISGNGNPGGYGSGGGMGGGGGGANGRGGDCFHESYGVSFGGDGGAGCQSRISGSSVGYGGGGGGGMIYYSGSYYQAGCGVAGGGNGGRGTAGCPGTPNTGGGGGGSGKDQQSGGAGGKGVVIIRYLKNGLGGINCATGGTVYCNGNYVIHCFTDNGTFCIVN